MKYPHKVAVLGAGVTKFVRRALQTGPELCWEAATLALENAGLTIDDIDCVALVSAPDAFDGVHMKGEYLLGGAGGKGKPYIRTFVGGGSGVFAPIEGWYHIASGAFKTCLVIAEEKMSSTRPHPQAAFNAIYDQFLERPLGVNLLWIFSLEQMRYMTVNNIPLELIAQVAVKNKHNARGHPSALLGADVTVDEVLKSEVMSWPVTRLQVSPVTDGAAAMVLASDDFVKKRDGNRQQVWVQGTGWCLDSSFWTNRELAFPEYVAKAARMAYDMAGVRDPRKEIHVVEPYDPFAYKELHHLEGLLLADKGQAPRLLEKGFWDRDTMTGIPSTPSGGLLGVGNPIAAAGLMKVAEIFWQLRGEAGPRQIKRNANRGLAQAWGDLMQVGTVVVLGTEENW